MARRLLYNARIVNEGKCFCGYVGMADEIIEVVAEGQPSESVVSSYDECEDLEGALLLPGVIDDQVHFREPGLTHKADIASESKAAVAGGVTSYMDMPNTMPQTVTIAELEAKNTRASEVSWANYGFFIGATNNNIDELRAIDYSNTPGIKLFLGASTGNMLVDDEKTLDDIFSLEGIIAIHSEDEKIIRDNMAKHKEVYGDNIPVSCHPAIRSEEACYVSTKRAVERALKHGTRLHVFHLSTAKELEFFTTQPLSEKKITAEVCVHHLWFSDEDYQRLGTRIKWNPAIKTAADRKALQEAVNSGKVDVVATDHAPHLLTEKQGDCSKAASGGPMVQHSLIVMLELAAKGVFSIEKVVETMSHNPAILYGINKRGYIREGYYADLVVVKPAKWTVSQDNVLTKCGWSPLEGEEFSNQVAMTIVNGNVVYKDGEHQPFVAGKRMTYDQR